ncbi:hypothetical protein SGPA1_50642 [Streptomyces misionensis JCM 4497]
MDDGAVRGLLVVEEDEVGVRVDLALRVDRDRGGVQVEVRARGGADVPAEAHGDGGQARSLLGERDVATLGQAYSHVGSFLRREMRADEATVTRDNAEGGPHGSAPLYLFYPHFSPVREIEVTRTGPDREHGRHVRSIRRPRLRLAPRGRADVAFLQVVGARWAACEHQ